MLIDRGRSWIAAASLAALLGSVGTAHGESLADALALAYQSNPALQSQRALQRQLDETYVQARAGYRPTANATGTVAWSSAPPTAGGPIINRNSAAAAVSATQPLYTGGRTAAAVDAAEATVLAGRQNLRATEQTVLQSVVTSYIDVLRDQQIVGIRQQSVNTLVSQLEETNARFQVGLLTRTDVARSQAQLAAARAALSTAQANLQNSRAAYTAAVGQNPGELAVPDVLPGLPVNVDEGFRAAESENPSLQRAQLTEQASRYRVAQVRALRNPTVSILGAAGLTGLADPFGSFDRTISLSGVVTQPLFTGGAVSSQIRAAIEQNNSDRILIEQSRRATVQSVAQAWNQMQGALGNTLSNQEQVRAATVAFEGTQEQYRVGLSTTLDVLLTEETVRSAQISLVQSQHDLYVAQAALLAAMGRLDARSLVQGAPLYDPAANFQRVKSASSVPWEHAVESLDHGGEPAPADALAPLPGPAAATAPTLKPTTTTPSTDAGFATVSPTIPALGTASPAAPGGLGQRAGVPDDLPPPSRQAPSGDTRRP